MTATGPQAALFFDSALLPDGWARNVRISIVDGRIATLEVDATPQPGDDRHAIALPGMPNLHSHAFQRAMAGMAECLSDHENGFWSWRDAMYRFVGRIGPDHMAAIAAMAQVEMLESGFTRAGEFHYLHHNIDGTPFANRAEMSAAVCAAAAETGIALTHLPVFYAHAGFGGRAPEAGQRRFVTDIDGFARLLDDCRTAAAILPDAVVGIAPHSLRAVEAGELAALAPLAAGAPIHIHIAEQTREVEECVAHYGARPVEWLLTNTDVDRRWCLVHATHVTDAEITGMADAGAVVGLCPITEANLGDGIFPAAEFLAAGGRIGIGSDSNVLIDMTEELRLLEYGQRLTRRARNVLASPTTRSTGRRLFDAALAGGAQALGAPAALVVGNAADILSLDATHPTLVGKADDAILDTLIFAGGRALIDTVWRYGRPVVVGGHHIARDAVSDRYRRTIAALLA